MFFRETLIERTGESMFCENSQKPALVLGDGNSQRTLAECNIQGKCVFLMECHWLTVKSHILGKTQNQHRITTSVGICEGKD
jgi:hypothetical protein